MPSYAPQDESAPYLVVNADDLGMSAGINAAIFEAHDRGIVTSTSLMAVGAAFEDALSGLRRRPNLGAGIHLVLNDEASLAPRERVPHLRGVDGRMRPLHTTARALLFGRVPEREIEAEYRAQIERVLAAGIVPTHLDSHCHLGGIPRVGAVLHRLGREYKIPCARRSELSGLADFRGSPLSRYPIALVVHTLHRRMRARLADPLRMPERFVGMVNSGALSEAWLVQAIGRLRGGELAELMVHPGDGSGEGHPYAKYGPAMRRRELDALTSAAVRAAIERRGVRLVDYRELARR